MNQIVIADECGNSMWDAVLYQEVNACDVKGTSIHASLLLNSINAVQKSNPSTLLRQAQHDIG